MDRYDPQKRVGLMVDEWGTWYDAEPGAEPGANRGGLYQQNTLRDAIVAGINLNIFNNHSDRVRMANIAQMVNVLQAMILTEKERIVLTPTYHVFRMYKVHQGATRIPVELTASLPALNTSASRDSAGRVHLSLVNLDPYRSAEITASVNGLQVHEATGELLTAAAMNAMNTFDTPAIVKPVPLAGIRTSGSQLSLTIPSKSVVVLEIR
jgi:alpha-N-arabinofuranosidase